MHVRSAHPRRCGFLPKCHSPFFFVELMSGVALLLLILVLDGASMIVASTIVPFFMSR